MTGTKSSQRRNATLRTAQGVSEVWEKRTWLVKKELAAESAANDAKTARLRAMRLAKEAEDAEISRIAAKDAPPAKARKRVKRDG
jgi:hypothetical protein